MSLSQMSRSPARPASRSTSAAARSVGGHRERHPRQPRRRRWPSAAAATAMLSHNVFSRNGCRRRERSRSSSKAERTAQFFGNVFQGIGPDAFVALDDPDARARADPRQLVRRYAPRPFVAPAGARPLRDHDDRLPQRRRRTRSSASDRLAAAWRPSSWPTDTRTGRQVALKLLLIDNDREATADPRDGALGREAPGAVWPELPVCAGGVRARHRRRVLLHRDGVPGGPQPVGRDRAQGRCRADRAVEDRRSSCASSWKRPTVSSRTLDGRTVHSFLHGDLKPRNIRVLDGDEIKVLDFGIAKALSLSRKVTRNDFGSIAYMSPERIESAATSTRRRISGRSACCSTRWSAACSRSGPLDTAAWSGAFASAGRRGAERGVSGRTAGDRRQAARRRGRRSLSTAQRRFVKICSARWTASRRGRARRLAAARPGRAGDAADAPARAGGRGGHTTHGPERPPIAAAPAAGRRSGRVAGGRRSAGSAGRRQAAHGPGARAPAALREMVLILIVLSIIANEIRITRAAALAGVVGNAGPGRDQSDLDAVRSAGRRQPPDGRPAAGAGADHASTIALADGVIGELPAIRTPTVWESQWQQAREALAHAWQRNRSNRVRQAALRYCEGQLRGSTAKRGPPSCARQRTRGTRAGPRRSGRGAAGVHRCGNGVPRGGRAPPELAGSIPRA